MSYEPPICEVCGKEPGIYVCCSSWGAMSCAYCESCATHGAEPYGVMVAGIACAASSAEDAILMVSQPGLESSLQIAQKSRAELLHDVVAAMQDMDEYFAKSSIEGPSDDPPPFSLDEPC